MKPQYSPAESRGLLLSSLAIGAVTLSGCAVVGGIFKAGVWVGVLSVVAAVALLIWGIKSLLS